MLENINRSQALFYWVVGPKLDSNELKCVVGSINLSTPKCYLVLYSNISIISLYMYTYKLQFQFLFCFLNKKNPLSYAKCRKMTCDFRHAT